MARAQPGRVLRADTGPVSLGGGIFTTPSPVLDGSGRIVVAVKGGGDTLYTIQQTAANSSDSREAWHHETNGVTTRPTAVVDAAARAQIFYRGSDGSAWRVGQTSNHDSFTTSVSLGGAVIDRPTVALGQDGRLNVLAKSTDKALRGTVQDRENGTPYSAWQSLGGVIGDAHVSPVIANHEGLLHAFTQGSGTTRHLFLQRQTWA